MIHSADFYTMCLPVLFILALVKAMGAFCMLSWPRQGNTLRQFLQGVTGTQWSCEETAAATMKLSEGLDRQGCEVHKHPAGFRYLSQWFYKTCKQLGLPQGSLRTSHRRCQRVGCHGHLIHDTQTDNVSLITVYTTDGALQFEHTPLRCDTCRAKHCQSWWEPNHLHRVFYPLDSMHGAILVTSNCTAFEIDLLREFEGHMVHHQASFESFADWYNEIWSDRHVIPLEGRAKMCRKRLADGIMRLWLIQHLQEVGKLQTWQHGLSGDIDCDLDREIGCAQDAFTRRWGLYHRCCRPGCCIAAGADGHMKCRRSICSNSRREQYIECESVIGGKVRTGCTNSPLLNSRYCADCQGCEQACENERPSAAAEARSGVGALAFDEHDKDVCTEHLKCDTRKDKVLKNMTTAGILAVVWSCGIVIHIAELYGSESTSQVYVQLMKLWEKLTYVPRFFFYDDACHLVRYMLNPVRFAEGKCSSMQRLFASVRFFVDSFHFGNHVDPWCKENMDPKAVDGSDGVNTQVCEQLFHSLAKYKHAMRHMNRSRFLWFALRWCHLHNCSVEKRMSAAGELAVAGADSDISTAAPPRPEQQFAPSSLYVAAVQRLAAGDEGRRPSFREHHGRTGMPTGRSSTQTWDLESYKNCITRKLNAAWYARLVDAARPNSSRSDNVQATYQALVQGRQRVDWIAVIVNIFGLREAKDAGLVDFNG